MGLIDSLTMAARSLQSQQYAMDVTGHNIANVNTAGYARRVTDFVSVPPKSGGGVDVQGVRGIRDLLLERRLTREVPLASRHASIADALGVVETTLGKPGESIDGHMTAFFDAFTSLAENPASPVARNQVQVAGQSLATAFNEMATRFDSAQRDADTRIRHTVTEINSLAGRIAQLNDGIGRGNGDTTSLTLRDQQSDLLRQLSELVDISVIERQNGGVDVTIGSGRALVVADVHYQLGVTNTPPAGYAALTSNGFTVTSEITGGSLGGLLQVRDSDIPSYENALDTLASDTIAQVNSRHQAGFDLAGVAGIAFFQPTGVVAGAAAGMQVNAAIVGNNALIAAAGVALAGDNGAAKNIADLRSQRVLNGNTATLTDSWSSLVYQVGADAKAAADMRDSREDVVREVDALRDQVAGVSLDEEALNMLKFQRAYEANARFFTIVDRMLDTLVNGMVR
jgi:flagellar hook-associated protein 1